MKGFVKISTDELLRVCKQCAENFHNYNPEKDGEVVTYYEFSFLRMKRVEKRQIMPPHWAYRGCGILTRLKDLSDCAKNVDNDDLILEKCVLLSYDDHVNLYKLLNKDEDFQPYIFGGTW